MVCVFSQVERAGLVGLMCASPTHPERTGSPGYGQSRFLPGGGDVHALTLEYLRVSIKIIQPTKHIAKGDRN